MKKETTNKNAIIIGAGPSGCTIARVLADEGYSVTIYEKRKTIAGNLYDYVEDGIRVQPYGPHIFHTNEQEVFNFLSQFTTWYHYEHRVKGVINGKTVPIPFNYTSMLILFGKEKADYLSSVLKKDFNGKNRATIMDLLNHKNPEIQKLGQFVYDKVFKKYTSKQWGLKLHELSPSVGSRVPVCFTTEDRYFMDTYQYMPENGFTALFNNMINHPNINVQLDTAFEDIFKIQDNKIFKNDLQIKDPVIFTGCIDQLFDYQFDPLPYRTLKFEFKKYNKTSVLKAATVNHPNANLFTRISEFNKFTTKEKAKGVSICAKEYPSAYKLGDIPYYPVETSNTLQTYQKYLNLTNKISNLYLLGRLANYHYINIDQAVKEAMMLAKKIAEN